MTIYDQKTNSKLNEKSQTNFLEEKWKLVPEFLKVFNIKTYFQTKGLMKEHTISYSFLLDHEIKNIVRANYLITSDVDANWYFKFLDVRVGFPVISDGFAKDKTITPFEVLFFVSCVQCRLRDLTYSAPIHVDIEYIRNNSLIERKNIFIGKIPIMLKCSHCVLYQKNDHELKNVTECPLDPGGYFIVKGVERVLLVQEQMMNNRIFLDQESDGSFRSYVVSSTYYIKSRTVVYMKGDKFVMKHSSFSEDIPVMVIFKAMGLQTDQEVAQLIGTEDDVLTMFTYSIENCHLLSIHTSEQALNYISTRIRQKNTGKKYDNLVYEARELLNRMILAHVPVINYNFRAKGFFLALMIRRVILGNLGHIKADDRDYYGNKRLELAGSVLYLLVFCLKICLNASFLRFVSYLFQKLKKVAEKFIHLPKADKFDAISHLRPDIITQGLTTAIGTVLFCQLFQGNWTIRRFNMHRVGVTQVLSRLSYISCLGMMTRINSLFEKTRKVSGPRSLQPSQWGMICPSDTPEGEGCGLVKNFALLSHVTSETDENPIRTLLYNFGVEGIYTISGEEAYHKMPYTVFLNGQLLGVSHDHNHLVKTMREHRRKGLISPFISISTHQQLQYILVATDGGRMCRPCIIVKNAIPTVTDKHLDILSRGVIDFEYFTNNGLVEYLDVNEENDALIAISEEDLSPQTTHIEMAAFSILGICAGLIPFPHHNQSPRNTYQCAMGKQAMGSIAFNQHKRMDNLMYLLAYPQAPLVKTKTLDLIDFDKLPAGQNATVAVMSYSGYDIEDALILNKASLDRGFARCLVYKRFQVSLKNYANQAYDRIQGPSMDAKSKEVIWRHKALDRDGICCPGVKVESKQILVNKSVPINATSFNVGTKETITVEHKDSPLCYKAPIPAYVDKVLLTSNQEDPCLIKVLMRQTRRPELGDKFSSRHGQKGVIGMIFNQEDMPFNEEGICPDIIMNPHGFPSRMTVGKLVELLSGKNGLIKGEFKYGTAFEDPKVEELCRTLEAHGFSSHGKDILISGTTGEIIPVYIYMGPIYYQKLKHMVVDKMHARSRGPRAVLTRQPTEGRSKEGGLRLGEMERDCLIGYGASLLILERLMLSSDVLDGEYNLFNKLRCQYCKSSSNITILSMPYACKLLIQELQSMNVVPHL
ncbi:hypothetical protein HZS_6138, partial [Henneguya salminicola]